MGRKRGRKSKAEVEEKPEVDESESLDNLIAQLPVPPIHPSDSSRSLEITENQLENWTVPIEPTKYAKPFPKSSSATSLERDLLKKISDMENEIWKKNEIISKGFALLENQKMEHSKIVTVYQNEQKNLLEETQALKDELNSEAEEKQRIITEYRSLLKQRDNVINNNSKTIESLNSKSANWDKEKAKMGKKYEADREKMLEETEVLKEKLILDKAGFESLLKGLQKKLEDSKAEIVRQRLEIDRKVAIISANNTEKLNLCNNYEWRIEQKDVGLLAMKTEYERLQKEHTREMETRAGFWYFVCTPFRWFWPLRKRHKAVVIFGCLIFIRAIFHRRPPPADIALPPRFYGIPVECDRDHDSAFGYLPFFMNS